MTLPTMRQLRDMVQDPTIRRCMDHLVRVEEEEKIAKAQRSQRATQVFHLLQESPKTKIQLRKLTDFSTEQLCQALSDVQAKPGPGTIPFWSI